MGKDTELAQAVKVVREETGLKPHHFADKLGISPAMVSSLETGRRNPSPTLAMKIADLARDMEARNQLLARAGISPERIKDWYPELAPRNNARRRDPREQWLHVAIETIFERAPETVKDKIVKLLEGYAYEYGVEKSPITTGSRQGGRKGNS